MTHPITQQEQDKPWQAYSISEVKQLLKNAAFPWWIAGGLAIELFVGRALRPHADIDVLLLRKDQILARKCFLQGQEPPRKGSCRLHGGATAAERQAEELAERRDFGRLRDQ